MISGFRLAYYYANSSTLILNIELEAQDISISARIPVFNSQHTTPTILYNDPRTLNLKTEFKIKA